MEPVGERREASRLYSGENCSDNRKMYRYHGRANAIRPYNNPKNLVNPDSKPNRKHPKAQKKRCVQHP